METIPPPSDAAAQAMYWQPGRWIWNDRDWHWTPGQYVNQPLPTAAWEPGHWAEQPGGKPVWVGDTWGR